MKNWKSLSWFEKSIICFYRYQLASYASLFSPDQIDRVMYNLLKEQLEEN